MSDRQIFVQFADQNASFAQQLKLRYAAIVNGLFLFIRIEK